jgi:choline dehydrogenase
LTTLLCRSNIAHAFVKSAQLLGYPYIDFDSEKQIGVSYVQQTTENARRVTAAKAYLQPVAHRENLHIVTNSRASKIIIEKGTLRKLS